MASIDMAMSYIDHAIKLKEKQQHAWFRTRNGWAHKTAKESKEVAEKLFKTAQRYL